MHLCHQGSWSFWDWGWSRCCRFNSKGWRNLSCICWVDGMWLVWYYDCAALLLTQWMQRFLSCSCTPENDEKFSSWQLHLVSCPDIASLSWGGLQNLVKTLEKKLLTKWSCQEENSRHLSLSTGSTEKSLHSLVELAVIWIYSHVDSLLHQTKGI